MRGPPRQSASPLPHRDTSAAGQDEKHSDGRSITGGDAAVSAAYLLEVLEGRPGPRLDTVLANAAAAIYVGGKAGSPGEAVAVARTSIEGGAALDRLRELRKLSTTLAADSGPGSPPVKG